MPDDLPPMLPIEAYSDLDSNRPAEPKPLRSPLDWKQLEGRTPPERDWVVDHWLPPTATLCAGAGGIGKTLLMQMLGTSISQGYEFVDTVPRARRVLFWAGEDDHDELWRRQLAICKYFGIDMPQLTGKFILHSYASTDITLAASAGGALTPTPMMNELRSQVGDYKAEYVILDSVARIFGGQENDRHQVTQFVTWLVNACGGAGLCLIGHPAKAAGSEFSGNTAWEASVRSRLFLGTRLPGGQPTDEEEADGANPARFLARRKANYSDRDWRKFTYQAGVLVPEERAGVATVGRLGAEFGRDIVLRAVRKLAERSMHGNASTRSPEYLPRLAKDFQLLEGLSERSFGTYMRELIMEKRLISQTVGRYSANRNPKSGLVEAQP